MIGRQPAGCIIVHPGHPVRRAEPGIEKEPAAAGLITLADKGYHGAGDPVLTAYRGSPPRRRRPTAPTPSYDPPASGANAQLKTWHILRKLRCCPWRAGQLAKAIHVLQAREIAG
jgi:hypothetical protein